MALVCRRAAPGGRHPGLDRPRRPTPPTSRSYLRRASTTSRRSGDEFDQILAEPFISRVLRPLGQPGWKGPRRPVPPERPGTRCTRSWCTRAWPARCGPRRSSPDSPGPASPGSSPARGRRTHRRPHRRSGSSTPSCMPLAGYLPCRLRLTERSPSARTRILRDLPDTLDPARHLGRGRRGVRGALPGSCDHFDSPLADEFSRTLQGRWSWACPARERPPELRKRRTGGARAVELRSRAHPGRRPRHARSAGSSRPGADEMRRSGGGGPARRRPSCPVKIMFPLVLFIFPPLFVVVLGPAGATMASSSRPGPAPGCCGATHAVPLRRSSPASLGHSASAWPWRTPTWTGTRPAPQVVRALVLVATHRTLRPTRSVDTPARSCGGGPRGRGRRAAVMATGGWESPFTFALLIAPVTAGLARGWPARRSGALRAPPSAAVTVGDAISGSRARLRTTSQWIVELVMVALIAGYARIEILGAARGRSGCARSTDIGTLVRRQHAPVQPEPGGPEPAGVARPRRGARLDRRRGCASCSRFDAAALLLHDDTDGQWRVVRWRGRGVGPARLAPTSCRPASGGRSPCGRRCATTTCASPAWRRSPASSLSGVLMARGVGDRAGHASSTPTPHHFTDGDLELLDGLRRARPASPSTTPAGSARLRTARRRGGAHPHRPRPPRPHRPVARLPRPSSWTACVGGRDRARVVWATPLRSRLREDVRGVIGEVRETLYDLRTDVSETPDGLLPTLRQFVEPGARPHRARHRRRTRATTGGCRCPRSGSCSASPRRPLVNVERHAEATQRHGHAGGATAASASCSSPTTVPASPSTAVPAGSTPTG